MYRCENCEQVFDEPDIKVETWSDPGVYPSGAGGYPLSSYDYEVECCPYCESDEFYEKDRMMEKPKCLNCGSELCGSEPPAFYKVGCCWACWEEWK